MTEPQLNIFINLLSSAIFEIAVYVIFKIWSRIKTKFLRKGGHEVKKVYACLIGKWVCLNDDPKCTVGENGHDPYLWFEEGAPVYSPKTREPNTYYNLDYVNIFYNGVNYRINPIFIQIVGG